MTTPEADIREASQQVLTAPYQELPQTRSDSVDEEFFNAPEDFSPSPSTNSSSILEPTAQPLIQPSPILTTEDPQDQWARFDTIDELSPASPISSHDPQDHIPPMLSAPVSTSLPGAQGPTGFHATPSSPTGAQGPTGFCATHVDLTVWAGGFDGKGAFPPVIPSVIPAVKPAAVPRQSWTHDLPSRKPPGLTPIVLPEHATGCEWFQPRPTPHPRPKVKQRLLRRARRVPRNIRAWWRRLRHPFPKPSAESWAAQMAALA